MPETIQEHAGTLVVKRCWCGIQHAVPQSLVDLQQNNINNGNQPKAIFCPLGHQWIPTSKTDAQRENERLRREAQSRERALEAKRRREAELESQLETQRHRTRAEKAAKTRLKNRVAKGVCPCCNRHFANVHRHIESQHPEYTTES